MQLVSLFHIELRSINLPAAGSCCSYSTCPISMNRFVDFHFRSNGNCLHLGRNSPMEGKTLSKYLQAEIKEKSCRTKRSDHDPTILRRRAVVMSTGSRWLGFHSPVLSPRRRGKFSPIFFDYLHHASISHTHTHTSSEFHSNFPISTQMNLISF